MSSSPSLSPSPDARGHASHDDFDILNRVLENLSPFGAIPASKSTAPDDEIGNLSPTCIVPCFEHDSPYSATHGLPSARALSSRLGSFRSSLVLAAASWVRLGPCHESLLVYQRLRVVEGPLYKWTCSSNR